MTVFPIIPPGNGFVKWKKSISTEINFVAFHARAPHPLSLPKGEGVRMAVLRTAAAQGCCLWKLLFER